MDMEPTSSGVGLGALITKFGFVKVLGMGSALMGAAMMAVFRPPKSRKELFLQGAVALGTSLMFGGAVVSILDYYLDFINLTTAPMVEIIQFNVAVHGLLGTFAWGLFGGLAVLRDKFSNDPIGAVKEIKNDVVN
jgi:hypothetical protein